MLPAAFFEQFPPGYKTFLVTRFRGRTHSDVGEFAVIDPSDRRPKDGDLFLIQWQGGRREVVEVTLRTNNLVDLGPTLVWYANSDGPYFTEHLHSKLIGRVIGYSTSALGELIGPEAIRPDENKADAAFDAHKYLEALTAAGYQPVVVNDTYLELITQDRAAPDLEARCAEARDQYYAAPSAYKRVKTECERRGWTAIDLNRN